MPVKNAAREQNEGGQLDRRSEVSALRAKDHLGYRSRTGIESEFAVQLLSEALKNPLPEARSFPIPEVGG